MEALLGRYDRGGGGWGVETSARLLGTGKGSNRCDGMATWQTKVPEEAWLLGSDLSSTP